MSLAILISFNLRTNHIFGNDIHLEYYEFQVTARNMAWVPDSLYSSCLSITILPTMISGITGLHGEMIFKFFYPFVLSLVPVIIFKIYRNWIGARLSFAVTLFFIASTIYLLQMPSLTRQIVALFFLVLAFSRLMKTGGLERIDDSVQGKYGSITRKSRSQTIANKLLFFAFSFGVIISHYSTGLMFLGLLFFLTIIPYLSRLKDKLTGSLSNHKKRLSLSSFAIVASLGFVWYAIICRVTLTHAINYLVLRTIQELSNFWILESRPLYALELVGISAKQGLPDILGLIIGNIIRAVIIIGLIAFLISARSRKGVWKEFKISNDFAIIGLVSTGVIVTFVVLPYIARVYNLDRVYLSLLMFLLPFLVVGIYYFSTLFKKIRRRYETVVAVILSILIISQLIYSTGLLHQATGNPRFLVLNSYQDAAEFGALSPDARYYIFDQDVSAVQWISKYQLSEESDIVADHIGKLILSSYGLVQYDYDSVLREDSSWYMNLSGIYFFLRGENTLFGRIWIGNDLQIPNVTSSLAHQNKIFDSEISQIYQTTR